MPARDTTKPDAISVAIVGGGIAGLVTATRLLDDGACVTLFERSDTIGADAASWLAGGMLAPHCEAESAPAAIVKPGLAGIEWWADRAAGFSRNGTLVLAPWRDRVDLARYARLTDRHQRVDRAAIGELEPDLAGRFSEGLFFADEAHLDPRATMIALADGVAGRGRLHCGTNVEPAELTGDYDLVVDARGIAAAQTTAGLRPVRGEMLYLRTREVALSRPVRLLHPRSPIYVVPRGEGLFMVGATMIETGDARGISLRGSVDLLNAAYALHPAFAEAEVVETGAGLRPAFADNLPRATRAGTIVAVNGLYRHGFLLSPHLAGEAAALVAQPKREAA